MIVVLSLEYKLLNLWRGFALL